MRATDSSRRRDDVTAGLDELQQSFARVSQVLVEMVRSEEQRAPDGGDG